MENEIGCIKWLRCEPTGGRESKLEVWVDVWRDEE